MFIYEYIIDVVAFCMCLCPQKCNTQNQVERYWSKNCQKKAKVSEKSCLQCILIIFFPFLVLFIVSRS